MEIKKISFAEIIYLIYFAVMILAKAMGLYEGMPLYTLSLVVGSLLVLLKISMTKHTVAEFFLMAVLMVLGIAVWQNSGEKGLLIYIIMMIGIKNVPIERIFRLGFVVFGLCFLLQIFLGLTGLKEDIFVIHSKLGLGHMVRWSLGYPHPNVLHISYVILIAFFLYLLNLKGKKLIYAIAACFLGNLYVFMYSVSYTGFVLTIVYLVCCSYFSCERNITKAEKILIQAVFPVCVLFSVAGPLLIRGRLFEIIDKILNTRFSLSRYFLTEEPITLFGTGFSHLAGTNYTLDCSYTMALMHYGIISFILLCLGYFLMIRTYVMEERKKELAIIIGFAIAGISEPFLFNTSYKNLSLLFLGNYFFEMLKRSRDEYVNRAPFLTKILNKEIQMLPIGSREIELSNFSANKIIKQISLKILLIWKKQYKFILLVSVLAGIAGAGIYGILEKDNLPDAIYALRANCDDIGEESIYLDMDNLPENFNGRVLNYAGKDAKMCEFSGNIIVIEYVRGIVSSLLWYGAAAGTAGFIFYLIKNKRQGEPE